ncbi:MAG: antitoxin [Actinomycetota bacterium]|nr:antitoxin [Actinomycetota bacterium]MDA2950847.1 antitoxin [Actinomycetota bacterium]
MGTIYVRNVPDDVVERLSRMAERAKVSVNTYVLWELEAAAQRDGNAELLAALPDLGITASDLTGRGAAGDR